jgi:hypothetical protein
VLLGVLAAAVIVVHAGLQEAYHRRCKSTLIKVVLMRRSGVCTYMHSLLDVMETSSQRVATDALGTMLSYLATAR